ncbi:MAG: cation:proton antiporter [Chitinophagales bacterium]|nr:cation:proton antiporter [Chitinophagales bacterium]
MQKYKSFVVYVLLVVPLLAGIAWLLLAGKTLQPSAIPAIVKNETAGGSNFIERLQHPLTMLLLQIVIVITSAKFLGGIFKKAGQPAVIGEIAAGIFLGPSLLGWLSPEIMHLLFPSSSLGTLQLLSQIGLILFMFIIGLEVDLDVFKSKASAAVVISHVSIVFPYFLGVVLAWFMFSHYAPTGTPFSAYALFMGIAMSITAFPVLARIIKERKLTRTTSGGLAIICAAIDDVSAWCLLALVIAIAKAGSINAALMTITWSLIYVFVMLLAVKPLLKKLSDKRFIDGRADITFSGVVFVTLVTSALVAELIGIHALFGAFIAGVAMPASKVVRNVFIDKVEDVSVTLMLPLFFAFTGLRTQIGILNDSHLWVLCAGVIVIAVTGKFAGSAIAARLVGQSWKDSLTIGALMNTRGLMELIVLNIGYDLGILTTEIFTILVLMALITTLMTGPALNLIEAAFQKN